ncbi:hypothetical protein EsDP_00000744 [Epichloe bromicola]|uniref:Transcription factor TFIIIC complex subunit Tfc6 n=1 Tax=Epichloe bromicola TaxID=79588 RepID=A0ABQ0CFU1_9HYPO
MKTRTSNRTKKFTPEAYSFESDFSHASPPPPRRRPSSTFGAPTDSPDQEPISSVSQDEASSPSPAPSAVEAPTPSRGRTKKKPVRAARPTGYMDVESVTTDTHLKGYIGPYDRSMRGQTLIGTWYGPDPDDVHLLQRLVDRWIAWPVLPPKHVPRGKADDDMSDTQPWAQGFLEREARLSERWCVRRRAGTDPPQACVALQGDARAPYEQPRLGIRVVMGPVDAQREWTLYPGDGYSLTQSWLPYDEDGSDDKVPAGWIVDAGGIVTGMDWCPRREGVQLLALAVVPHADQENYNYESEHQRPDFQMYGTVQVWAFEGVHMDGVPRPSPRAPRLRRTICLDFGRVKRLRWSPVPDSTSQPPLHSLAVLCGDGRVCVVANDEREDGAFDYIINVEASLMLENEDSVKATAMAWATFNRLVVGYSDGSIALWSLYPCFMVSRHPVHHSLIVDIATGYPTQPFLVASTPIGGTTKLVDLSRPTFETTEVQTNAVSWQPNMLAYSHHLQGFYSVYPSANALNTMVGFLHQRFFPVVRRVFVGESYNSSLAVGRTHPFLLIGSTDGSLWSLNPQVELFNSRRGPTDRLRVFHHEHRSKDLFPHGSPASERGVSRFLHGFAIEKGRSAKGEVKVQPVKKQKRPRKSNVENVEADDDDDEEAAGVMDPTRGIVYEPLSRIASVEWNPNQDFGHWAAAAMATGLVRIMDLGLDNMPG